MSHHPRPLVLLASLVAAGVVACEDTRSSPDVTIDAGADTSAVDADTTDATPAVQGPEGVPQPPATRPFEVTRASSIEGGPEAEAIATFTDALTDFYQDVDALDWVGHMSHGVAPENPWDEPSYAFFWQGVTIEKADGVVTFVHEGGADNMMSHHGRLFGPMVGAFTLLEGTPQGDALRTLVLEYMAGVSATMIGSVWGEEDPAVETIMARAIFHRDHAWEVPGRGTAAVDYSLERIEEVERRHDTVHNPNNPTWGDIYVRNKRSKDDLPWVYRMQTHLAQLLWTSEDAELRAAAETLFEQLTAFSADILEHHYRIRAKTDGGEVFIHYVNEGHDLVDDYASMTEFEAVVPNGECNAKLPVALIATGTPADSDCGDGRLYDYEELGLSRFYGHTWMQWNFHLSAALTATLYGEHNMAQALVEGFGVRVDDLHERDDEISADPRFAPDLAQTLVLAAAYGMPLTADEAQLVIDQYERAIAHYSAWPYWNLWASDVPDGTYPYYPGASHEDASRDQIHIEEMFNLFEYCASSVRALEGAQFVDCDRLVEAWE